MFLSTELGGQAAADRMREVVVGIVRYRKLLPPASVSEILKSFPASVQQPLTKVRFG